MRAIVEEEEKEGTDTEITLGMKSLLGVFFGSVLICGVFFGFGYSLGRSNAHPAQPAPAASPAVAVKSSGGATEASADSPVKTVVDDQTSQESSPAATSSATVPDQQYDYVPAPGGPARKPAGAPLKASAKPSPSPSSTPEVASEGAPPAPVYAKPSAAVERESSAEREAAATAAPHPQQAALTETRPVAAAPGSGATSGATMVQIAAVTHQEDANILVAALRKRGYAVAVRNDPKDSLLHVQLGPFASRDEARAMRSRLLSDGYNAILK